MTEHMRRWAFLEDNPAVEYDGWFPPADECPELADLREQHEHVLSTFRQALRTSGELRRRAEAEQDARADALRDAILNGTAPDSAELPEPNISEAELAEAQMQVEVARDALQQFAQQAVGTVRERAPSLHAALDDLVRAAEAKRVEARRLLDEADRLAASPRRMRNWLDRATGDSNLGLYPYEELPLPVRTPVHPIFEEIAGLPPATVIEIGSDNTDPEEMEAINHA